MEFAAIDFETANERPDSACQLGVVIVEAGEIVGRHSWLIRPRPMRFSSRNIAIHGITPDLVRDEADFSQLWQSIQGVLGTRVLVAHNARFDIGVLRACLQRYALTIPDMLFTCTRDIARQAWPREPGYGLRAVADRLGIHFQHHDALEDAECCAKVLLMAAGEHSSEHLDDLEQRLGLMRGRAGAWGCAGTKLVHRGQSAQRANWRGRRFSGQATASFAESGQVYQRRLRLGAFVEASEPTGLQRIQWSRSLEQQVCSRQGLSGVCVAMTGTMLKIDRELAESLVQLAGGTLCRSVTKQTTLLVVGAPDSRTIKAGRVHSTKQARAEQLRQAGQAIEVITEAEFLKRLLPHETDEGASDARSSSTGTKNPTGTGRSS